MIRNINYVAICNFMDYAKQVDKSQGEKAKRIIEPKPGNTRKKGTVQEIRRICERKEKNKRVARNDEEGRRVRR